MKSFVCQYGKRIRPKYFQNSRMVLSSLWNDDKYVKRNCLKYFRLMYLKVILCYSCLFCERAAVTLGKFSSSSVSHPLLFVLLNSHIVFCESRKQIMGQDHLSHLVLLCIECTLHKKWTFPLKISLVNVIKSAFSCGFGLIYWRNH